MPLRQLDRNELHNLDAAMEAQKVKRNSLIDFVSGMPDYGRGMLAGLAGMPGDMEAIMRMITNARMNYGSVSQKTALPTSDELGKKMGANTDSGGFIAGTIGTPDFGDIMRLAGAKGAMVLAHGSPHMFDKFSMSKIGTGEGAQAYGHGLYFAEDPKVAGAYRQAGKFFANADGSLPTHVEFNGVPMSQLKGLEREAVEYYDNLRFMGGDPKGVAKMIREAEKAEMAKGGSASIIDDDPLGLLNGPVQKTKESQIADWIEINADKLKVADSTHLYEVDIPDEQIAKMLDWDKPLSEQPESVRSGVNAALVELKRNPAEFNDKTGQELLNYLMPSGNKAEASQRLNAAGIPGIKYLDGTSRSRNVVDKRLDALLTKHDGNTESAVDEFLRAVHESPKEKAKMRKSLIEEINGKTRNFVVFDENIVEMLSRNGQPVK